jgi:AbrB family looped-hinge helix DNA binding protein
MVWYNAIVNTILTVDKAGRVVLPKPVRDELHLSAGDSLNLETSGDRIVLRPVRESAAMREKEGIWVFRTGQPVSTASVNETIRQLREEREQLAIHPEKPKSEKRRRPR